MIMTEDINYLPVAVRDPEKTSQFLISYLGFLRHPVFKGKSISEKQGFLVGNKLGNYYLLANGNGSILFDKQEILVHTDDCLRDYYQLNSAGIHFEKRTQYTENGLEVRFSDEYGNQYKLLEKRDYSDT